jgi:hypothetical protein
MTSHLIRARERELACPGYAVMSELAVLHAAPKVVWIRTADADPRPE